MGITKTLELVEQFANETEDGVWSELLTGLLSIATLLQEWEQRPDLVVTFNRWRQRLYEPMFLKLGWTPKSGERTLLQIGI